MGAGYSSELPENNWINQIFFLGKCSNNLKTNQVKPFYQWCAELPLNEYYNASCEKFEQGDTKKACSVEVYFNSKLSLLVTQVCDSGKWVVNQQPYTLKEGLYEKIQANCEYWLNGRPLPWWLLLIIIFFIIVGVAILAALLWTYWIKRRWNAARTIGSTLTSRWTSSPVSSTASSMVSSSPKPAPPIRTISAARNSSTRMYDKTLRSGSLSTGGRSNR